VEEQKVQSKAAKRSFVGIVTSDKMDKTIVVSIDTKKMDRLYKKYVTRTKKCKAHDEKNEAHEGDTVMIAETRPISKTKTWTLVKVIEKSHGKVELKDEVTQVEETSEEGEE
jgi:small subunit ribosomal protein S17